MDSFLLCPPEHFVIDYCINPWMTGEKINLSLAISQWENLSNTIKALGGQVKTITPVKKFPDMVFTANAGIVFNNNWKCIYYKKFKLKFLKLI